MQGIALALLTQLDQWAKFGPYYFASYSSISPSKNLNSLLFTALKWNWTNSEGGRRPKFIIIYLSTFPVVLRPLWNVQRIFCQKSRRQNCKSHSKGELLNCRAVKQYWFTEVVYVMQEIRCGNALFKALNQEMDPLEIVWTKFYLAVSELWLLIGWCYCCYFFRLKEAVDAAMPPLMERHALECQKAAESKYVFLKCSCFHNFWVPSLTFGGVFVVKTIVCF